MDGKIDACFRNGYINILFCVACFFIALLTGIIITQSGTGISPDSVYYIQSGESFYSGNGYTQFPPDWPPLYPTVIAVFMHLGLTAEDAARMTPILCFALSMFPLFFLGRLIGGNFTAYIACLISLVFTPLLTVTSWAWTEMIYIFLSLMAILALAIFINTNKNIMLYASGIFTGLAFLTRYIGITLFVTSLISLILNRDPIKNRISNILIFSSISLIPISLWIYRNTLLTGRPFGGREPSPYGIIYNIDLTIRTILKDFFTVILPKQDGVYIIAIIIIFCAMIFLSYKNTSFEYFKKNYILIIYILIYLIILIVMASVTKFDGISYRLTSPAYPFMLLTLISFIHINLSQLKSPSIKRGVLLIFFIIIFIIQLNHSVDFYQYAKMGQGFNTPDWRNNPELHWLSDNLLSNNTIIYTNDIYAIMFLQTKSGIALPNKNNNNAKNNPELLWLSGLKSSNSDNVYIVYFKESGQSPISNEEIIKMNTYNTWTMIHNSTLTTIFKIKLGASTPP
jgi:4-amino-4-deoxy-L-arabinose transferase-like glycosyltransferase